MQYNYGNTDKKVTLADNEYIKLNSCGYQKHKNSYTMIREKGRSDWHLLYVHEGSPRIYFNGLEYILNKGDFVIYAPYQPQKYIFKKSDITYFLHFDGTICDRIISSLGLHAGIYKCDINIQLEQEFLEMLDVYSVSQNSTILNEYIIRLLSLFSKSAHQPVPELDNSGIRIALNYMNTHYTMDIDIDKYAMICGLSTSRFMHLFKEKFGKSPYKFLLETRISKAKELLKHSQLRICDVSREVGFEDSLYFSRIFKKYVGLSPKKYQQNKKNKD